MRCAVVKFTAAAMLLLLAGMAVRVAARGRAVSSGALTGSTQSSSLVARHVVCSLGWRGQSGHSSPPPRCLRPTLVNRAHPRLQAFVTRPCVHTECSRLPGPFLRTIAPPFFPPCSSLFSFLLLSSSRTLSPFVIKLLGPSTRARAQYSPPAHDKGQATPRSGSHASQSAACYPFPLCAIASHLLLGSTVTVHSKLLTSKPFLILAVRTPSSRDLTLSGI